LMEKPGRGAEGHVILLVDDEANVLTALFRLLRKENYRILTASSGEQGLKVLKKMGVQLVITDQKMPEMSGIELLRLVSKEFPEIIRIMLTGYSDLKLAEEAINKGEVYRFLTKPWSDEDLKAAIRQGLERYDLERKNKELLELTSRQNEELKELNQNLEQLVEERTRKLKESQEQLIQSEKMAALGLLIGGVAHEINNPLTGIIGLTQLLLNQGRPDTPTYQDLKEIETSALKCKSIVEGLLSFSRQQGKEDQGKEDRKNHNINQVIKSTLSIFENQASLNEIKVMSELSPDLPPVSINFNQIQQVLLNLITNACQAMTGGGELRIVTRYQLPDGGQNKKPGTQDLVEIVVSDTGQGISPENLGKIFDPFFTTKEEGKGTGLGLAVSYGIIQDHKGSIRAESEPGRGTSFTISLPASRKSPENRLD
jgi:signal transduction histidine kinase